MNELKSLKFLSSLVVVAALGFLLGRYTASNLPLASGTTPSSNAIENYVPAILYNGGYYSTLPIQTTSDVTAAAAAFSGATSLTSTLAVTGATTLSSTLAVTGLTTLTGTTTLTNGLTLSKTTGSAGCITFYATSTGTLLKLKFEATGATSTFPGEMLPSYGACQ